MVILDVDRNLTVENYQKPTHTGQYLHFDSHRPLEHKLVIIRTLHNCANNTPIKTEGKEKEHRPVRTSLRTCGYPNCDFLKSTKGSKNREPTNTREDPDNKRENIVVRYVGGLSEKLRRIFFKHDIPVHFRPRVILRQRLVHPRQNLKRETK